MLGDWRPATCRSYAHDPLRWLRLLAAVGTVWEQATRGEVALLVAWMRNAGCGIADDFGPLMDRVFAADLVPGGHAAVLVRVGRAAEALPGPVEPPARQHAVSAGSGCGASGP
jgi:hypothetical protein